MMKKIWLFMLLVFGSFAFCMAQEMQEVVYLKNGSVIRGVIIEQVPGKSLKIQTNDGNIFAYEMAEVEKISKEQATTETKNKQSSNLSNNGAKRGYRGFVEMGYTIGKNRWSGTNRFELVTSRGYQFNPYFYVGLGTGVHYYHQADLIEIPIFADLRADFLNYGITPFVDFKIGYTVYDCTGLYISPTVGCRFGFKNMALNLGFGYTMQKLPVENYFINGYVERGSENVGGISIKLGVDF